MKHQPTRQWGWIGFGLLVGGMITCGVAHGADLTDRAKAFVAEHEKAVRPLEVTASRAWWNANTSGKDEDFKTKQAAEEKLVETLADRKAFAEAKSLYDHRAEITDPTMARCIEVIYLQRLSLQTDPALSKAIIAKENAVEQAFNVYRAKVDGKELTASAVTEVLKTSKDSAQRKAVWEASKGVGKVVEKDLKELVKLRNEGARQLGFKNFHEATLFTGEQTTADVMKLFDELDQLTRGAFDSAKREMDQKLAANCGVKVEDLRPWHYHDPFFQEAPAVFGADLDAPYRHADLLKLSRDFYAGIGLPIDDVLQRGDYFEKPGKSPHAFCSDIDREGDVRVLANVVPNEYWMNTLLHELGHSVYSSKNIPKTVPYTLRTASHTLTTEGLAMMLQRLADSELWIKQMGITIDNPQAFAQAAARARRNELLVFSRWCQVMLRFEKSMYENPDQDLNALWWDLEEKYQGIKRPEGRNEPDYASKIHIVTSACYYHNYMMGDLFASQVHHAIARDVYHGADPRTVTYVGNKAVGQFLQEKIFNAGNLKSWNELTKFATGENLNAKAFAQDFKGQGFDMAP
ncbi:MAG TPA: M2 family metallopeptidase [Tepidisphaeraceae bacterium]|jgi:peptidyl-dipeptidase A